MAARKSSSTTEVEAPARRETGIPLATGSAFQGVVGQDGAVRILSAALEHGRLSHAYLFIGPPGVGRELVARRVAAALLCSGRSASQAAHEVCGRCPACARVDRGVHPDVHLCITEQDAVKRGLIVWDEDRKPSTEIKVEQIRQLRDDMRMTAFEGGWRIAIIPEANKLRVEAANALLKTLEEPLPNSLLVLCAPDRGSILETLRSRCQRISFSPLPVPEIVRIVVEKKGWDEKTAKAVALESEGSVGRALESEPDAAAAAHDEAREWLDALQSATPADMIDRAEELDKDREKLDGLIRALGRLATREAEGVLSNARTSGPPAMKARWMLSVADAALTLRGELAKPGANVRLNLERFMLAARASFTDSHTAR